MEPPYDVRKQLEFDWFDAGLDLYAQSLTYQYLDGVSEELREWMRASTYSALGTYARMDIEINYEDASEEDIKIDLLTNFGQETADPPQLMHLELIWG